MEYHVGIARRGRGSVEATVFGLAGCRVEAPDMTALRDLLPIAIAEHAAWLERHHETLPGTYPIDVEVVEDVDVNATEASDGEFCFADDRQAITDDEIERAIRHMGYSRADVLATAGALPDDVLDWKPPASAMARTDPWSPDVLTIREIVVGIGASEQYYRNGLSDGPEQETGEEPSWAGLAQQRAKLIERLRGLREDERVKVFQPQRPWQNRPEHWTARKVVRRVISHERFHTKEIEQRLAWLLLGVPTFETSKARSKMTSAARAGRS